MPNAKHISAAALCSIVMCALLSGVQTSTVASVVSAPPQYAATVKPNEATFSMPVPAQRKWSWRRAETKNNAQEYRMDVSLTNEGRKYNFGFYLWKFPGAEPHSGSLAELVAAGQASVFERTAPDRNVVVRDAGIKLKVDGDRLLITIHGRDNVNRLFSGRPAEATFRISTPDTTPLSQTVSIEYQN